jgi:nitric oxide reductase large subunit
VLQRIQSIYLFLSALAGTTLFVAPVSAFFNGEQTLFYKQLKLVSGGNTPPVTEQDFLVPFLAAVSAALSLVIIFLFKKRPVQIRLVRMNMLLVMGVIALILFYVEKLVSHYFPEPRAVYLWGAYLPFLQVVFLLLAARAIKKDEELVKAADRIR